MDRIICIAGPTASGKTALAVELAKALDGEVISCDSMQIYKYMDIGTAKVTTEEMDGVPHHMLDCEKIFPGQAAMRHDHDSNQRVPPRSTACSRPAC